MPVESFGLPEVNRRQLLLGAAGLSALALSPFLAACSSSSSSSAGAPSTANFSPKGGGKEVATLTWALFADPVSMDYAFAYDFNTNPVVSNMVDPLLRLSPEGQLQPALATAWKQTDDVTYVYTLRKGVLFHDGTTMTAADAEASMNRILDPATGSYLASFVGNVDSVKATGPNELTITLKSPDALWQYVPATSVGSVVPAAFLAQHKDDIGKPGVGLIGTGPYKFVSWQQGQQAVIAKNDKYWNTERAPKIGQITFRVIASETTVIEGMANGEIDGAFNLSGKNLPALKSAPQMQIARSPSYFVHFMGLNVTRKPFDDLRVRQALSYAIDKAGILASTWGGDGSLCKSPSTPAMWSFEQKTFQTAYDSLPGFSTDIDKAKSLISAAGAQGATATILVATDHEQDEGVAVQAAAKEIGLEIKLQRIPYTQLLAKIADTAHDYDGIILEWSSDYPDPGGTLFQCFESKNLTDYTAYENPKVTAALSRAAVGTDPAARAKDLSAAQAQIVADQSWIVFFTPYTNMPLSKTVGGYELRPLWYWDNWAADLSGV
jgi:peptide/nickel transport system substrate-binding protein